MSQPASSPIDLALSRTLVAAQILSILAIPVVLALVGYWVQASLQEQQIKRDYVSLAVSLLLPKKDGEKEASEELRAWAVQLLNNSSPVKLSEAQTVDLKRNGLELKPGDIIYFDSNTGVSRRGIYLGDDQFVHPSLPQEPEGGEIKSKIRPRG